MAEQVRQTFIPGFEPPTEPDERKEALARLNRLEKRLERLSDEIRQLRLAIANGPFWG